MLTKVYKIILIAKLLNVKSFFLFIFLQVYGTTGAQSALAYPPMRQHFCSEFFTPDSS